MRKHVTIAVCGARLAAGSSLIGGGTAAAATPSSSAVVGHTYVNDNSAGANTIAAFDRHADGSLTPTPGSPFPAGGVGLGAGLGSQGAIQSSPDRRFLLAVDAGSNPISVLRVSANGVPVLVGTPVSSGGVQPVSITDGRPETPFQVEGDGFPAVRFEHCGVLLEYRPRAEEKHHCGRDFVSEGSRRLSPRPTSILSVTRRLVAAHYVWDEYPGLRVGKLYSGAPDLGRHPRGATHAVASADAADTVCGLDRSAFSDDFEESVTLRDAEPCTACGIGSPAQVMPAH